MKERAVIIGGAGFLGSHIADSLYEEGFDVTIFDYAESAWLKPEYTMVVGDIGDEDALKKSMENVSYVYHLAGIADIGEAKRKPINTINSNIVGSAKVIEAALEAKVKRFMFASTIYVYSDQGSFYRVSKQAVEHLIEAYHESYGLDYTILRYGSLYGPRAQKWNGIKKFIMRFLNDNLFTHAGTGEERRDYIHVKDAARLSVEALDSKFSSACLTITGVQTLTSKELLTTINEILGNKINIEFKPENRDLDHYSITPYRFTPRMAQKMIPEVFTDIGQGILEMIEEVYFEDEKNKL